MVCGRQNLAHVFEGQQAIAPACMHLHALACASMQKYFLTTWLIETTKFGAGHRSAHDTGLALLL
jgi:hypothetical protein